MTGTKIPPKKKYPQIDAIINQKSVTNGSGEAEAEAKKVTNNKNGTKFLSLVPMNFLESGPLKIAPRVGLEMQTTAKPVCTWFLLMPSPSTM